MIGNTAAAKFHGMNVAQAKKSVASYKGHITRPMKTTKTTLDAKSKNQQGSYHTS